MRKLFLVLIAALSVACAVCVSDTGSMIIPVTSTSTNAATLVSSPRPFSGWIESIDFDVVTASTTGTLRLVASPVIETMTNVTLAVATNCTTDRSFRLRVDGTDRNGTALSSDPPWRFFHTGNLTFSVTNASATNITFNAVIRYEK